MPSAFKTAVLGVQVMSGNLGEWTVTRHAMRESPESRVCPHHEGLGRCLSRIRLLVLGVSTPPCISNASDPSESVVAPSHR